ncbi:protein kinase family protein [Intrasporangium sp.]|uniref:protein kinase family protein n=1 Tax=Intrasporangium sp. TaxID=1925024 RepID=UPI0032221D30
MQGVGPGSVLAGRYAVTLRTAEGPHHERWRATDQTLERDVVLVCFPSTASVTAATLDAARRAAGLEDPRLVRVLDVGTDQDVSFVVEEPLTGSVTLAHLLVGGGLLADEVRRLVGESAVALEKARHRGLHHLALTPDCVLRMPDGAVKVRGLATDAALADLDGAPDDLASRVDAVGLVRLTYAGLTGRWPAAAPERVPPAPHEGLEPAPTIVGGLAAPSEIAVGVPTDLDLICRQTLADDAGPASPGDLANQLAPWPHEAPTTDGATAIGLPRPVVATSSTRVLPGLEPETEEHRGAHHLATAGAAAAGAAAAIGDRVGSFARAAADKAAARAAERRAAHTEGFDGEDVALHDALEGGGNQQLEPPVPLLRHPVPEAPSRTQARIALAIVGALVLVALVIGVQNVMKIGRHDGPATAPAVTPSTAARPSPTASATSPSPSPTKSAAARTPIEITGGTGFDPEGHEDQGDAKARLAFDGDRDTQWQSRWFATDDFNGSRDGVGLVLDLDERARISQVELVLPADQDVTVYAADRASLAGAQKIGKVRDKSGTVKLTAPDDLRPASKVIVWVTKAAPAEAPNRFRAQVSEVVVR